MTNEELLKHGDCGDYRALIRQAKALRPAAGHWRKGEPPKDANYYLAVDNMGELQCVKWFARHYEIPAAYYYYACGEYELGNITHWAPINPPEDAE